MPTALKDLCKYNSTVHIPVGPNNIIAFDHQNVYIKLRRVSSDDEIYKHKFNSMCTLAKLSK